MSEQLVNAAEAAGFEGEDLVTAVAIALSESGGDFEAVNTKNRDGSSDHGAWQINTVHRGSGFDPSRAFDPVYNAQWAKRVHDDAGGWTPWVDYKNGNYREFLDQARELVSGSGVELGEAPPALFGDTQTPDYRNLISTAIKAQSDAAKGIVFTGQTLAHGLAGQEGAILPDQGSMDAEHAEAAEQIAHAHGSGDHAWGGHENGRIPEEALTDIGGGQRLESAAASAWLRMVEDAARDGVTLDLTDSYRSYEAQVDLRRRKGDQVATADPGTSIHGWGRAIDVKSDAARTWVQQNGSRYGWVWPEWAQREGTKSYEPWHFEFSGTPASAQTTPRGAV